jgi:adenosine deaminase
LKQLARTGMEHNFLPGASLWAAPDAFTTLADACRGQVPGSDHPSAACKTFLEGSQKATAQWEQERRFRTFEAQF